jgi:aspartate/methionine/tyrosine aminotransferase
MELPVFALEAWMRDFSKLAPYNIADTCADYMTLEELMAYGSEKDAGILKDKLWRTKMKYGEITGSPELKLLVAKRYGVEDHTDKVLMMNGALLANYLVMYTLIQPGDHVIAFHPGYEQLYEVPRSFGAHVDLLHLQPEDDFVPDLDELRRLIRPETKLIAINNPNNPTGTLLDQQQLEQIAAIARSYGAYVLCDEVCFYKVYEKGIATSSFSKAMSFPGLRMGWMVAPSEVIAACTKQRDYLTISCGVLNDLLAVQVLTYYDQILQRNRDILRTNVSCLEEWVKALPQVTYIRPRAGTAALMKLNLPYTSEQFCKELLNKTGVLLTPGSCLGMEGYVRLGCASNSDMFKQGLALTGDYIRNLPS